MYIANSRITIKVFLKNYNWHAKKKKRKWNHIKCSVKITKGRKRVEDKTRNKDQGKKTENSNEYGRHSSKHINYHFECMCSNCTNKKTDYQNGTKNKTQLYVVYKIL